MSYYIDITKAILSVLRKLNKPISVDEIAFRVRSTPVIVKEGLDKLYESHLVKKIEARYSIEDGAKSSSLEAAYSY